MTAGARPLDGRRILVTRPRDQARALVTRLRTLGAAPIEAPAIRIAPPADPAPLAAACAAAGAFDWIVFTSANGVDAVMAHLPAPAAARDPRPAPPRPAPAAAEAAAALGAARLCAIGPATAARLARHGLRAALTPAVHRGEAVSAALRAGRDLRGARILLPRADRARAALPADLRAAGAEVVDVVAYRTVAAPPPPGLDLRRRLDAGAIDVVTFTSASAVHAVVGWLGGAAPAAAALGPAAVASLGPVTAQAARACGIEIAIQPADATVPALVHAIADHFAASTPPDPPRRR